jgi:hypothetical protein
MTDRALIRTGRVLAGYAVAAGVVGFILYASLGLIGLMVRDWVIHNAIGGAAIGLLVWPILARQPSNRAIWALIASAAFQSSNALALGLGQWQLARAGLPSDLSVLVPAELPLLTALTLQVSLWVWVPGLFLLLVHALLLFPDGRLPGPGWRWVSRGAGVGIVATSALFLWGGRPSSELGAYGAQDGLLGGTGSTLETALMIMMTMLFAAIIASTVALVRRYRASTGIERQQFRWIAWGGGVLGLGCVLVLPAVADGPVPLDPVRAATAVLIPVFLASYVIAVARHRLYEIDRLISRTASYLLVLASLGLTYLGLVISLQLVLGPLTSGSELAVAASTLAVAAAFRPVHRWIREVVDRRFDRAGYDARQTVEAFAHALREDVDLQTVQRQLGEVASATVDPAHVSVWLAPAGQEEAGPGS